MHPFFEFLLFNTLIAGGLAVLVVGITRVWRNPHLAHALWLLVLIKLITPPLFRIEIPRWDRGEEVAARPVVEGASLSGELAAGRGIEEGAGSGSVDWDFTADPSSGQVVATAGPVARDSRRLHLPSWKLVLPSCGAGE